MIGEEESIKQLLRTELGRDFNYSSFKNVMGLTDEQIALKSLVEIKYRYQVYQRLTATPKPVLNKKGRVRK